MLTVHPNRAVDIPDLIRGRIVNINLSNGVFYSGIEMVDYYPAVAFIEFKNGPAGQTTLIKESYISSIELWPT